MAVNVAQVYGKSKMQTASKEDIITMLYDGAIKFCNIAESELDNQDYAKVNDNLKKAQRIIGELILTLDKRYPVSEEFEKVYNYILSLLIQANVKKDKEVLARARDEIRGMRDTWLEVVKKSRSGK